MDRYTYRSKENPLWVGTIDHSNGTESENSQCVQRLCELEDRIESGLLIELPCKIGDTVYLVHKVDDGEIYYTITVGKAECVNIDNSSHEIHIRYEGGLTYWHDFSDFGKEVFTDKSEAEAKLKELQGKE